MKGKFMRFNKKTKQKVIDDYLAASGRNIFLADEFVDWMATQPEHEMYDTFYGVEDDVAARNYRIDIARRMASGLRIVVKEEVKEKSQVVSIKVAEYPAFISPIKNRRLGGGYQPFDPDDEDAQTELRKQAGVSLNAWLERYRGASENIGLDMSPVEHLVRVLRDDSQEEEVA